MEMSTAMKCSEVHEYVDVYVDGEFAEPEKGAFDAHLRECEGCRTLVDAERGFRAVFRQKLPPIGCPPDVRQRVLDSIDEAAAADRSTTALKWAAVALAAALVAAVLWPGAGSTDRPADDAGSAKAVASTPAPGPEPAPSPNVVAGQFVSRGAQGPVGLSPASYQAMPADIRGGKNAILGYMTPRMPFRVSAPLAEGPNLTLRGAREIEIEGKPAVLYIYDHRGTRVSVGVAMGTGKPGDRPGALQLHRDGSLTIGTLSRRGFRYFIVSELEPEALHQLATRSLE